MVRDDVNDVLNGLGDHIGWVRQSRAGRLRASARRRYLHSAMTRPNPRVVTGALVRRVLFEGTRATGVAFARGGVTESAMASGEVILSAGAIGSPHVPQMSGVGDPGHRGEIGGPVVHGAPGVGRHFQDHFIARMSCDVQGTATLNEKSRGLGLVGEMSRHGVSGQGLLTYGASLVAASVMVLAESATPDVQALFASARYAPGAQRRLADTPGAMWRMRPLRP